MKLFFVYDLGAGAVEEIVDVEKFPESKQFVIQGEDGIRRIPFDIVGKFSECWDGHKYVAVSEASSAHAKAVWNRGLEEIIYKKSLAIRQTKALLLA